MRWFLYPLFLSYIFALVACENADNEKADNNVQAQYF